MNLEDWGWCYAIKYSDSFWVGFRRGFILAHVITIPAYIAMLVWWWVGGGL